MLCFNQLKDITFLLKGNDWSKAKIQEGTFWKRLVI